MRKVSHYLWNIICYLGVVIAVQDDTEADIKKTVLENYDPTLPPALYSNNPHFTFVNFRIFRIRGLDEKKGEFFVEGTLVSAWIDTRFTWESKNIKEFRVREDEIWMPSFYVYNAVSPEEITSNPSAAVVVGGAYWEPRYNIRTSCDVNLKYYPFDKHVCDIIIASRSKVGDLFSGTRPSFFGSSIQTYLMIENPQWNHDPPKALQKKMKINSDSEEKVIIYRFSFQRSMPLIPLGILTPCLCCALLLLTTFWMQTDSTMRAGLCTIATLISTSSLFTLGKILPASGSSTPIIVQYVSITLILSALSSIQTMLSSLMRRCEKLPPVSYTTVISKIPTWCLWLMGVSPQNVVIHQLEQKFLFSELEDTEGNISEREENKSNTEQKTELQSVYSLWMKYTILIDRIMFYILCLILLLFLISVVITE